MKVCEACGHTQETGNFCGKCGTKLIENKSLQVHAADEEAATYADRGQEPVQQTQQQDITPEQPSQKSEQIEKIKQDSKLYWNFFLTQLQKPSGHLSKSKDVQNGVISMILFILITVIALYTIVKKLFGTSYFFEDMVPSFFQMLLSVSLAILIMVGINLLSLFVTTKLFSENLSFTTLISQLGGFYVIPIILSSLGLFFSLIKSFQIASLVLYLGLFVAIGLIPVFIILRQLQREVKSIDRFYAFLFYLVVTLALFWIVILIFADSTLGEFISILDRI